MLSVFTIWPFKKLLEMFQIYPFYSTVWFSVPHIFLDYKKTFVRSHEMHNEMNGKISKEI